MRFIISIIIVALLTGCGGSMDIEQTKKEIMDADRAFSKLSEEQGFRTAFETYMADSAVIYRPGKEPFKGHDQIMPLFPADAQGELTWEPYFAEAAESGELGYTLGKYEMRYTDEQGAEQVGTGHYVTIWKRQGDGSWKYVFDTGT